MKLQLKLSHWEIRVYVTLAHSLSAWKLAGTPPGHLSLPSSSSEPLLPHTPSAISFFFTNWKRVRRVLTWRTEVGQAGPSAKVEGQCLKTAQHRPVPDGWTRSPSVRMIAAAAAMAAVWVLGFICPSVGCFVFGSRAHATLDFAVFPANQN